MFPGRTASLSLALAAGLAGCVAAAPPPIAPATSSAPAGPAVAARSPEASPSPAAAPSVAPARPSGVSSGSGGSVTAPVAVAALRPQPIVATAVVAVDLAWGGPAGYRTLAAGGWDAVVVTIESAAPGGPVAPRSQTFPYDAANAGAQARFEGLPPGEPLRVTVALRGAGAPVGAPAHAALTPTAGGSSLPVSLDPDGTAIAIGDLGTLALEATVLQGEPLTFATGLPAGAAGVAAIQAFVAPAESGASAVAAEAAVTERLTDPAAFARLTWRTDAAGLTGGGGEAPERSCRLFVRAWNRYGGLIGQTAPMRVVVLGPATLSIELR